MQEQWNDDWQKGNEMQEENIGRRLFAMDSP
jgi:hypothetical protein